VTLSHRLNPTLREYRRASSTAIDASLKPVMSTYLRALDERLAEAGFAGRVLVVTSGGGVLDAADIAEAPVHSLGSGPAMAPVAGRRYALLDTGAETVVVADTGGTSYDVSLVRRGQIPTTRETWLGEIYMGHMTGFPSIDVRSIGAGGGSIARVDDGGLLHVGPASAGAVPGPACYGRGGTKPTVTDACLALGYLDPGFFLGGAMTLDVAAARAAIDEHVARPLGLDADRAADAIVELATERMAQAIEEITVAQGIDPRDAVLVAGGGAAGLNSVGIARRLGCRRVLVPEAAAALSAAGALLSDLRSEFAATFPATTATINTAAATAVIAGLVARCEEFARGPGSGAVDVAIDVVAEARYPSQNWEIDVPLPGAALGTPEDVARFRDAFHATHRELFAIDDPASEVEVVGLRARVSCRLVEPAAPEPELLPRAAGAPRTRSAWFRGHGSVDATVVRLEELAVGEVLAGPALVESAVTTVVVDPGATVERTASGGLLILPWGEP
jgi:N-methylhydantoinase A